MAIVGSGSCICGDVTYTFTEKPVWQILCHCHKCRKFSSSTNTTFVFVPRPAFHLVLAPSPPSTIHPNNPPEVAQAAPKLSSYTVHHESGLDLSFHWCARCGTKIYKEAHAEAQKDLVFVAAGTLDGKDDGVKEKTGEARFGIEDVKVDEENYVRDRVPWLEAREGAVQRQRLFD